MIPCTTPSAVTPDEDDPYSYIGYRTYETGIAVEPGEGHSFSKVMYPLQDLWLAEMRSSPVFALSVLSQDEQYWVYTERFLCRDQLERYTYREVVDVLVLEDDLGEGEGFARHCYFQEERDHFVFAVVTHYTTKIAGELYPEVKRAWRIDQSEGTIQEISTEGITCTAY